MIAELDEATEVFGAADKALDAFLQPMLDKIGWKAEDIQAKLAMHLKALARDD